MRIFFVCIIISFALAGLAQERYYSNPVGIPMLLSGSFAELRSNHFHSGIDIKTQGVTGLPIFSAADGYISRIAVSPTGFGKAIYINHPNGTTTVYAHLERFNTAIAKYVKDKQYKNKSFRVDLQVPQYLFPVEKGQEIGKSGNSGSSGGPHLHFEIRDTKSEEPLNPLKYNFPITDNMAPKIFSLMIVPLSQESTINSSSKPRSFPVVFYDGKYHIKGNPTILVNGKIGFSIHTNDYFDGAYNKCGINLLRLALDEETYFTFQLNRFSFANSRYINSHIVYDEFMTSKKRFIKTWMDPGNKLPIYTHNGSMGAISVSNEEMRKVEIEVQDTYGNASFLQFSIKGIDTNLPIEPGFGKDLFLYDRANKFSTENVSISIPKGALYENFDFIYSLKTNVQDFYSNCHSIHNKNVPLHKNASIRIKANKLPEKLHSKAIMVNVDEETGEFYAMGGKYNKGWVETSTRTLGTYAISVDTIPPEITPLSIKNGTLTESNRIRFKITDDLSGIKTIVGLIDGKWALFDYDAKTARISHYFDKERFELNRQHNFELTISDYRGNISVYKTQFWK